MLLTGRAIDAATAASWGLINRVTAPGDVRHVSLELAETIAGASEYTVACGKQAFYDTVDAGERAAYDVAKQVMTSNALAPDAHEGISAFLAKRTPVWSGP